MYWHFLIFVFLFYIDGMTTFRHISPGEEEELVKLVGKDLSNEELLQLLQSDQELGNAVQMLHSYHQNGR